jgi:hypothetical protein
MPNTITVNDPPRRNVLRTLAVGALFSYVQAVNENNVYMVIDDEARNGRRVINLRTGISYPILTSDLEIIIIRSVTICV